MAQWRVRRSLVESAALPSGGYGVAQWRVRRCPVEGAAELKRVCDVALRMEGAD